ncbi:hypothetical protein ACP4OV_011040 [Aristida adscensionis]
MGFKPGSGLTVAVEWGEARQLLATCKEHLCGYWYVSFFQQVASVGNNIAIQIAAGSSLKAVYRTYYTSDKGAMTLQQFILLFGAFELFLSQLPAIHSLRWVNAICTASTVGFAGTSIGLTIYDGYRIDRSEVAYSLQGSTATKIFRAFNAMGTIAFSFGDAMLPEIQVLVQPDILSSLTAPRWAIVMANLFAVIQITGCFQPTSAHFEEQLQVNNMSCKSCLWRLMYTSLYMAVITLISAAMPFFGEFVSVCRAVGFTPLDFVLPAFAFLKARKPPETSDCGVPPRQSSLPSPSCFLSSESLHA